MKAQHTPIRVSLPAGESLRDPDTRIEKVRVGLGEFIPPHEGFEKYRISPSDGNLLVLAATGVALATLSMSSGRDVDEVRAALHSAREKLYIPSAAATPRTLFNLGATVLRTGKPITAPYEDLHTLDLISRGFSCEEAAAQSIEQLSAQALKTRLWRMRRENTAADTPQLITQSLLSRQLIAKETLPSPAPEAPTPLAPVQEESTPELKVWVPENEVTPDGHIVIGGYTQRVPIS